MRKDVTGRARATVSESPDSRQDTGSARDLKTVMVALIHNHSPALKVWRVLGVILMLTQSGCDVKDNRIKKRRLRARRECVAHQFIAEADGFQVLLAMDAVYYLERLVEIAEQSYEVVRRRTILDRSEAATIKRRVRAKVARMMTKLSLPDRAAPAVVTPSTPAVAPSAAKGAFGRVDDSE